METPYSVATLKEVQSALTKGSPLFFDTETIGLYGKIRLAQFYQKGMPNVLLVEKPDYMELATLLNNHHVIMHNASYDVSVIQVELGKYAPPKLDDTMYLARLHWYKEERFSLDKVMQYALKSDPYESQGLDKKILQKSDWSSTVLTKQQLAYAATDVFYMPSIWEACREHKEDLSYKLDMLALKYALDFQCNGFPVDSKALAELYAQNKAKIAEYNLPINVNSYQQVRPYIGSENSNGLGLAYLALKGNTRAAEVREVRGLIKQNSFLSKFDTPTGRIYGRFAPSARSGRFTCKAQNLEQLPRKTKGCFGVDKGSGRCLVYSDYATLELRAACAITGEHAMEKLFREGADLHGHTAAMLFRSNYSKVERQIAKTANFNLLYGGGHKMLGDILVKDAGILLEEHELAALKRKWLNLWAAIAKWQKKGISNWRKGIAGSTPFGRRYVAKMMTDQLNIEVQGFGAEIAKLAMHYMMPKLRIEVPSAQLVNFIHDSYIIECNDSEEEYTKVSTIVAQAMQEAWKEATQHVAIPDLPMPVEVAVGYNWGAIEAGEHFYKLEVQ